MILETVGPRYQHRHPFAWLQVCCLLDVAVEGSRSVLAVVVPFIVGLSTRP